MAINTVTHLNFRATPARRGVYQSVFGGGRRRHVPRPRRARGSVRGRPGGLGPGRGRQRIPRDGLRRPGQPPPGPGHRGETDPVLRLAPRRDGRGGHRDLGEALRGADGPRQPLGPAQWAPATACSPTGSASPGSSTSRRIPRVLTHRPTTVPPPGGAVVSKQGHRRQNRSTSSATMIRTSAKNRSSPSPDSGYGLGFRRPPATRSRRPPPRRSSPPRRPPRAGRSAAVRPVTRTTALMTPTRRRRNPLGIVAQPATRHRGGSAVAPAVYRRKRSPPRSGGDDDRVPAWWQPR